MRNTGVAIRRKYKPTCAGSSKHIVYFPEMQSDGQILLVEQAVEDTDEIIQSYFESTTLECILSRFMNGDLTALQRYQPIYMDVTQQPKSLAEALQTVINSRHAFDHLPVEIKQKFNNDFNQWLAAAGSPLWLEAMSPVMSPAPDPAPAAPDPVPEASEK